MDDDRTNSTEPTSRQAGGEDEARKDGWGLPVLRPLLPDADALRPYLERIDASRVYSNGGPLSRELEQSIADRIGEQHVRVAVSSSGTSALMAAILASAGPAGRERPLAAVPAYTFVATALAVQACGYEPLILDVRPGDHQLDPASVEAHPARERIGLVLTVGPYGQLVSQRSWSDFQRRTNIPVVIDGAACLDRIVARPTEAVGDILVACSLHATKSYGIGEGGAVVSTSDEAASSVHQALNHGFTVSRMATAPAINGKLSEYAAAVGLAVFERWSPLQARFEAVAAHYRDAFAEHGLGGRLKASPELGSSYVLLELGGSMDTEAVLAELRKRQIGHRLWYGLGIHRQPLYETDPIERLPVTDDIAPRLLGLPNAPDLDRADIHTVARSIAAALGGPERSDTPA